MPFCKCQFVESKCTLEESQDIEKCIDNCQDRAGELDCLSEDGTHDELDILKVGLETIPAVVEPEEKWNIKREPFEVIR